MDGRIGGPMIISTTIKHPGGCGGGLSYKRTLMMADEMAPGLPWRYLLVDVDGTLLDSHGEVSPRTLAALHRVHGAGIKLVLATGRTYPSLRGTSQALHLPPFHMITNGGAVALTPNFQSVDYTHFLSAHLWPKIVTALEAEGLSTVVFAHRHPDAPLFYVRKTSGDPHFERYIGRHQASCRVAPNLHEISIDQVVQVAALGGGNGFDEASARVLTRFQDQTRNHSMVLFLNENYGRITEFFQPGTSKWRAFLGLFPRAAQHPRQVVAVGDEANDVEMITQAGLGVAMGNATPELKSAANVTIGDHDQEGLAKFLEDLLEGRIN